ncbi:MAG: class I SAM-dependent DNA methyltransferase [Lachnospirales bacterium]
MSYEIFAKVYDEFMEDTPYNKWCENLEYIWNKHNKKPKLILDLGCGTGTITTMLAKKGYDLIGVDLSYDMLMEAKSKNSNILYLNQDMRNFELYGTVDVIYSLCDSLNYILEIEELIQIFKLVNNYLNPKGLFIFDMNTEYKFKKLGSQNFGSNTKKGSYIWENYYDEKDKINEYYTTIFIKEGKYYKKYEEEHYEKAYTIEEIKDAIEKSGLEFLYVLDEHLKEVRENSERIYFVCSEKGKR